MKKTLLKVLLIVLTVCVFSFAFAASAVAVSSGASFALTPIKAKQGETFTTTLYLEADSNVIDFEFQLSYDKDLFQLISAEESEDLSGTLQIVPKTSEGKLHISFTKTSGNVTRQMELVNLVFQANENIGVGVYDLLKFDNSYRYEAHTMNGTDLNWVGMVFDFNKLSIFETGDVNLDNRVSIVDVTMLRQHLAAIRTLSDFQLYHADSNVDGNASISDAVRIQQKLADPSITIGDRFTITFYNQDESLYTRKSVKFGADFDSFPNVPELEGYSNGRWSVQPATEVSFEVPIQNVEQNLCFYAVYDLEPSPAMAFYKARLDDEYKKTSIAGDLDLRKTLTYQNGYHADIYWTINNKTILDPDIINGKGVFRQPTYDSQVALTATIISKTGSDVIESEGTHTFIYSIIGAFQTPSKAEIAAYLNSVLGNEINYNISFPQKLTNKDLKSNQPYEVRVSWLINENGTESPISKVFRTTTSQTVDLIAVITFNGVPLEGDGRVYFDDVILTAISKDEIRKYIIDEIAVNTGLVLSSNVTLWNNDTVYGSTVTWISKNSNVATIANNTVTVKETAINGSSLPLEAQVTYMSDDGPETFALSYTTSVANANVILVPGVNIDPDLHLALKEATGTNGTLTTDALKAVNFVYLDLSKYPEITDLSGLTYCINLRVLNISGLRITRAINEIATLNKLEALIARDCGLNNLTDGGIPVLKNAINLKLLDLANNNFLSLDSVFAPNVRYGKLSEVYLNGNGLKDISALQVAPLLSVLVMSDNGLTSDDITTIQNFKYLKYLSLANNEITSISSLKGLTNLVELRLQNNQITNVKDLQMLRNLQALYLGNNNIGNVFTGGGAETNVSYLRYLNQLQVLYLNDNNIEDVRDLSGLNKLAAFNITNNRVRSLNMLSNYAPTLVELYAENNNIATFNFVQNLTKLRKLMLAENAPTYEESLPSYLANLTNLETLTLSGKDIRTLSFLDNMSKLVRLEVAKCNLNATSGPTDNISMILGLKNTLKFLNISNNGFAVVAGTSSIPFSALSELCKLIVLYCDNLAVDIDAQNFFSLMTELEYISLENCGITSTSWLSLMYRLAYVDLANNEISSFNLGESIRGLSRVLLKHLYLDSNTPGVFADANREFEDNGLKELSIKGLSLENMDYLPDMDNLEYLNLSNTGVDNLQGSNPDFNEFFSIERFTKLKTVDVTQLDAKIAPLLNLPDLETVYAIGVAEDQIFSRDNILTLYSLHNKGVTAYLYSDSEVYEPVAQREGTEILNELTDISLELSLESLQLYVPRDVQVAADNVLSNNNPALATSVNEFPITWSVSNTVNYEIVNNKLAVKSYNNIVDEELTLTAQITVYPDQAPVERTFKIQTHILRASAAYIDMVVDGISEQLTRDSQFVYDVSIKAATTDGFMSAVKPVCSAPQYSYTAKLLENPDYPYINILSPGANHGYTVVYDAPFESSVTISVEIGHAESGEPFVPDYSTMTTIKIVSRTNTLTYHPNGGQVIKDDGSVVPSPQRYAEDSTLYLVAERLGYLFEGWFTDEALTIPFTASTMPAHDVDIYAKWKANSYIVTFNANGGQLVTTSKVVLCDTPYGNLPVPTLLYYDFLGWFTAASGGTPVTESTIASSISSDQTLYAQWQRRTFTLNFDANYDGGTVSPASKTVNCGDAYGSLPTPTMNYNNFLGWFTAASVGTLVTASTVADNTTTSKTIYARWEQKGISDWVLASQVPAGAQIVSQKWTYTHTQSSTSSTLPGGYYYVSTAYGAWSSWIDNWQNTSISKAYNPYHPSDTNHLLRDVQERTVAATFKTQWNYWRYSNTSNTASTPTKGYNGWNTYFERGWSDSPLPNSGNLPGGTPCWWANGAADWDVWYGNNTRSVQVTAAYTQWRQSTRTATYTYRRDIIEVTTNPTGGAGTSNIVEYVRYIPQ